MLGREKIVHAKKEEGEKIKMRHDESKKVSMQTTSNNSLYHVSSNLNISYSMWIILFVLRTTKSVSLH